PAFRGDARVFAALSALPESTTDTTSREVRRGSSDGANDVVSALPEGLGCGVCNCLRRRPTRAISLGMAFIVLRRSRNTRSYYLVESYRDSEGKTRRRTLCYLGRERDGTGTLAKAQAHWELVKRQARKELRRAGGERRRVI